MTSYHLTQRNHLASLINQPTRGDISFEIMLYDTCPMAVIDEETSDMEPCDQPTTTWNFIHGPEFPMELVPTCEKHGNAVGAYLAEALSDYDEMSMR